MSKKKSSVENPEPEDLEAFVDNLIVAFNENRNTKKEFQKKIMAEGIMWLDKSINSLIDQCDKSSHVNILENSSKKLFAYWQQQDMNPKSPVAPMIQKIDRQILKVKGSKNKSRIKNLLKLGNKVKAERKAEQETQVRRGSLKSHPDR